MADELLQSPLGLRLRALLDELDAAVVQTLAELGITDYRSRFSAVVRAVDRGGPMTIRALADTLGVTHSAASQTVAEMRRRGLVDLGTGRDARQRVVRLSARTVAMKPALDAEWEATEAAMSALNAELTATLGQVVTEMNQALERRSFRERIADAAAGLTDIDPEHRATIMAGRGG